MRHVSRFLLLAQGSTGLLPAQLPGGYLGPDLTNLGGTMTLTEIREAVLDP